MGGSVSSWQIWVTANLPDPKRHGGGDVGQQALVRCGKLAAVLLGKTVGSVSEWLQGTVASLSERMAAFEREQLREERETLRLCGEYKQQIRRDLDQMELFGAKLPIHDRTYPLSVAYISLRLQGKSEVGEDAERLMDGLAQNERQLFIEGKAGSGKSTLLRWIAVTAANENRPNFETWRWKNIPRKQDQFGNIQKWTDAEEVAHRAQYEALWRFQLPVLIRFRDLPDTGLPVPNQLPHWLANRPSSGHLTEGWLKQELDAGRVLLLLDGLDEVPSDRLPAMYQRLQELITHYANNRIIVSSRPLSRKPTWMAEILPTLTLDDLSRIDQKCLVDYWFRAFAEKRRGQELRTGELSPEQLLERGIELQRQLPLNTEASNLAKVPLLCALICAMFARDEDVPRLPDHLIELCGEVCQMLLKDRPEQSTLKIAEFGPIYGKLSDGEKLALLRELAFEMVRLHQSNLDDKSAKALLQSELGDTCPTADADDFLHTYVTVSGLLRFGEGGAVEFINNTIKEYLASKKLAARGDWKTIIEDPNSEICQRLSLFASYDNDWGRSVIDSLLKKGESNRAANLLALRCWGVLPLKHRYQDKMREIRELFRIPQDLIQAEAIAVDGEALIPQLRYNPDHEPTVAAACIHALHRIGTMEAKAALKEYEEQEKRFEALKELCEWGNPLDLDWIQQRVHSNSTRRLFGRISNEEVTLRGYITDARLQEYLGVVGAEVKILNLSNTGVSVIGGLEQCTQLQGLNLSNTKVSQEAVEAFRRKRGRECHVFV